MKPAPMISITDAMGDPALFGPHFEGPSWDMWRAVIKAAFCEPMTDAERKLFREIAEREPPAHRVSELDVAAGRGAGKDSIASFLVSAIAMQFDPRTAKLRPGEQVYCMCIAVDKEQAGIAFGMIRGFFETIPTLKGLVKKIGIDTIELRNRVVIRVSTCDFKSVRGRGVLCCIMDEVAFFSTKTAETGIAAANPDQEVLHAIQPGLARVNNSMLILISSVYRRTGILYNSWQRNYGKPNDDALFVLGSTRQFNFTFPQATIDRELLIDRPKVVA
jgi:hypothetical protein